jgi:hypothetical protein
MPDVTHGFDVMSHSFWARCSCSAEISGLRSIAEVYAWGRNHHTTEG